MIINRDDADKAWDLLRGYARIADEVWDAPHLILVEHITQDNVKEAYRVAAKYTHPDTALGGTMDQFVAVDRAKHVLQRWLERAPAPAAPAAFGSTCDRCEGLGYIKQQRGFAAPLRKQCPRCRGTGDLDYEHEKSYD